MHPAYFKIVFETEDLPTHWPDDFASYYSQERGSAMATVVYYGGDVQGVGFRATVVSVSRHHPLVRGWVRNLTDGRVEVLADGPADAVTAFRADIRERMDGYIQTEDATDRDLDAPLQGFRVVH